MAAEPARRPFEVRDSIEMTVLVDPDPTYGSRTEQRVRFSPDHRSFLVVERKGNLQEGCNQYKLLRFDVGEVRQSIAQDSLPRPETLAEFCSSSTRAGISDVAWLNNSVIAFLGSSFEEPSQLYSLDIRTHRLSRLTHHVTSVTAFDHNSSKRFIYMAEAPSDWSDRRAHGYVVGTEPFLDVLREGHGELSTRSEYFVGTDDNNGPPFRINETPFVRVRDGAHMWISPSGRWAVALRHVAYDSVAWSSQYAPIAAWRNGQPDPQETSAFVGKPTHFFFQYVLLDLLQGSSTPLIDAPCGYLFAGLTLGAHWSADEKTVILDNTFLPLDATDQKENERRRAMTSIVEIDLRTHAARRIVELPPTDEHGVWGGLIESSQDGNGNLTIRVRTENGNTSQRTFGVIGGVWTEIRRRGDALQTSLKIRIAQGPNQPPELVATDFGTGKTRSFTDFNPQFGAIELGRVETITWKDRVGSSWTGGLLAPAGHHAGARYPLVIQTGGYDADGFLADGPLGISSGHSARALASRDLVVLQVPNPQNATEDQAELDAAINCYEAAVEKLTAEGLVDPLRVGLHGFSRSGFYLQQALLKSRVHFAAATVADGSELSSHMLTAWYGMPYPGMLEQERFIGGPLWGDEGTSRWTSRDPTLHLEDLHTPLLIQAYISPYPWFDVFARLRREARPVEFMVFPDGSHQLFKPWQRLSAQEAMVDWYDFWLNDHIDSNPKKRAQYERWTRLRAQAQRTPLVGMHRTSDLR